MMWKTANSQYYFTKIKCPDFTENEFMKAIKSYQNRERRMGK
jgi:short-chain Z-isoprenyl diphosphate synthase